MNYYSLNRQSPRVSFEEATVKGQAPDKGLYFPAHLPVIEPGLIENIQQYPKEEIAFRVIQPYVGSSIPQPELTRIIAETLNFDFPIVAVNDRISALELFHGPTLAFKDVGARFMSRCLGYFVRNNNRKITVLVATSGDTGGAVASGFYGVDGIDVVILYPSGKVSSIQELQLTAMGKNISAIEVKGSFDDCQQLVKRAFADSNLNSQVFLTSANSINVARWLPQQFYYFFAYQQWPDKKNPPVISVPSGNFGNICAGLMAAHAGLPVKHFIAACNANDIVPRFFETGEYRPHASIATLSNAMDVGDPSNLVRILELFNNDLEALSEMMSSCSISDAETKAIMAKVFQRDHYTLDPHGAVGYLALETYLTQHPGLKGIFLETAHPVKFYDIVEPIIGQTIPIPNEIKMLPGKEKHSLKMEVKYEALENYLLMKQ